MGPPQLGPEDALDLLGRATSRISDAQDLTEAGRSFIQLVIKTHHAKAASLARAEGGAGPIAGPSPSAQLALRIARDLMRARLKLELDRERHQALLEAAIGTPPAATDPGDEGDQEPGQDPRGFRFRYDELVSRSQKMF